MTKIPKCPSCDKDAKKAPSINNTMISINNGYYVTCGDKECIKYNQSLKVEFRKKRGGVKFKPPSIPSIASIRQNSKKCYMCGGEKEKGNKLCNSKKCYHKSQYGLKQSIKSHFKIIDKRAYYTKKKKETDDFFDKMNKEAQEDIGK